MALLAELTRDAAPALAELMRLAEAEAVPEAVPDSVPGRGPECPRQ